MGEEGEVVVVCGEFGWLAVQSLNALQRDLRVKFTSTGSLLAELTIVFPLHIHYHAMLHPKIVLPINN